MFTTFLTVIATCLAGFAATIYIAKAWAEAKRCRDMDWATRPGAGLVADETKPSALPYLFK